MLTVTKLEQQKKNPERVNVYLDGQFAFGISLAVAPWLEEGKELTQEHIEELQSRDQVENAYQRAINFLSYRSRSEKEVRLNLGKHQVAEEHIELVLQKLREISLVNDRSFAREWVENRSSFKPRGRRALSSELFQKGIPPEIIEEVLEDLNEEELALRLARQKLPKLQHAEKTAFQSKLSGYLSRRGFSYGISQEIISTLWEELQE
jgi:regulatory protein